MKEKTKLASVNYFAIVVLATNKTCGTFPWQVSVFSVLWNTMFKNDFHRNVKKNLFHISTNIPAFFPSILPDQRAQGPISLPPVMASAISFIVFFDDTPWRSSAITLLVKLGLFPSLRRSRTKIFVERWPESCLIFVWNNALFLRFNISFRISVLIKTGQRFRCHVSNWNVYKPQFFVALLCINIRTHRYKIFCSRMARMLSYLCLKQHGLDGNYLPM